MTRPEQPPKRVSTNPNHKDFYPWFQQIGVKIDGEEVTNISFYDVDMNTATRYFPASKRREVLKMVEVEPFWREAENRQQRRARERWEAKHKG
jgi:hypothetical protein